MSLIGLFSFEDLMITVLEGIQLIALKSRIIQLATNILH